LRQVANLGHEGRVLPPMSHYTRLAGLTAIALASLAAAGASSASAGSSCSDYTWQSSPKVIVHESEFLDGGGDAGSADDMVNAVRQVVDQFNAVGATSAKITSVQTTSDPFVYNSGKKDGAIHVGFGTRDDVLAAAGKNADGVTDPAKYTSDCSIKQADILFPNQDSPDGGGTVMWDFSTPFGAGDDRKFFDAGSTDSAKSTWFRPSFLHELEHAWGFTHLQGEYTFMTHRNPAGFPWANRPANDAVRPLPYEAAVLRDLYPASGTRYDVAPLNTWWGPPNTEEDKAGSQIDLCKPSLGAAFSDAVDADTCGVDGTASGSTDVCAGDALKTRVALANYSTERMQVTTQLYFSSDEKWQATDVASPEAYLKPLDDATSGLSRREYTVPTLTPGTYRPILRTSSVRLLADGSTDPSTEVTDWIPLRGTVTARGPLSCAIVTHS
jgi:hypothetical protein